MSSKAKTSVARKMAVPALVPKLRFPEFRGTAGWTQSDLATVCDMQAGKFVSASSISERSKDGLFPCYGGNGLRGYTETHTHNGTYPLIGRQGALCGNVRFVSGQFHATEHAIVATPKEAIDVGWLYYSLDLLNLNRFATGQAQPGLSVEALAKVPVAVPLLEKEQQKIAECLCLLDDLMAVQARKVDALKTHKKGLMQQLFPREGEIRPRLRFPEFRNSGGWARMTLGQAATFYNGRAFKQEELLESGKYPVLRVGNFFTSNTWYYSDLNLDETKYCEKGDLLYAWSASFGPRIWCGEKSIYHYHIWKVMEQRGIDKQFLFITLEKETENMKAKTTNGLGIMHITKGAIEGWNSAFPSIAEQRKIAGCLTSLDSRIANEISGLNFLKTHKEGLMQQLFPSPDAI
ncbi:restriction endonuclease subunit S [Achromobacter xylosoxidans]|uniref:restriction endonuclease subunit S n=1 Tax=Alcaligenes xylosoxydans xylosoxydans TaxID=85698 RepID=UPI0006C498AD|nr:restriction endonuclease subunit S [Achromobacter xylosoxidans]CUI27555.1 Type I restriction enzyme specificity protein MG438 [Achromobacter xylosoxidans]